MHDTLSLIIAFVMLLMLAPLAGGQSSTHLHPGPFAMGSAFHIQLIPGTAKVAAIAPTSPLGAWIGRNGSTNWLYIPVDANGYLMIAGATGATGTPKIASINLVGPNGSRVGRKAAKVWTYIPTDGAGDLLVHVH